MWEQQFTAVIPRAAGTEPVFLRASVNLFFAIPALIAPVVLVPLAMIAC